MRRSILVCLFAMATVSNTSWAKNGCKRFEACVAGSDSIIFKDKSLSHVHHSGEQIGTSEKCPPKAKVPGGGFFVDGKPIKAGSKIEIGFDHPDLAQPRYVNLLYNGSEVLLEKGNETVPTDFEFLLCDTRTPNKDVPTDSGLGPGGLYCANGGIFGGMSRPSYVWKSKGGKTFMICSPTKAVPQVGGSFHFRLDEGEGYFSDGINPPELIFSGGEMDPPSADVKGQDQHLELTIDGKSMLKCDGERCQGDVCGASKACSQPKSTFKPKYRIGIVESTNGKITYLDAFYSYDGKVYSVTGPAENAWPDLYSNFQTLITFDGKSKGKLEVNLSKNRVPYMTKAELLSQNSIPSYRLNGMMDSFPYNLSFRPLVATTNFAFSDPDRWAPVEASPESLNEAFWRKSLAEVRWTNNGCEEHQLKDGQFLRLPLEKIKDVYQISKAYKSRGHALLVGLNARECQVAGPYWFFLKGDARPIYLGGPMLLIDAGDYAGIGRSQLIFLKSTDRSSQDMASRITYVLFDVEKPTAGRGQAHLSVIAKP